MSKPKTKTYGDTLFDPGFEQAATTDPSVQDELVGGTKTFRETGQIPTLTDTERRFLGMTAPPEWDKNWFPLSGAEHNLALRGITQQLKTRPNYAHYEASRAHDVATRSITSSTILNGPLDTYEEGTQPNDQDIRCDREALKSIAKVLIIQEASADGTWPRQGTKKFVNLLEKKIADLTQQDQETVLELAAKIARANRLRAAFWRAEVNELEATAAWKSTVTDSHLARRNDGR